MSSGQPLFSIVMILLSPRRTILAKPAQSTPQSNRCVCTRFSVWAWPIYPNRPEWQAFVTQRRKGLLP